MLWKVLILCSIKPSTSIHHPNHPFLPNITTFFFRHFALIKEWLIIHRKMMFSLFLCMSESFTSFSSFMLSLVKEEFYLLNLKLRATKHTTFLTHNFPSSFSSSSEIIQCGPIIYTK